ncbi:MAG: hypothetical protein NXI00_20895 [Cytophagales bacterium]|nr:hypothetical protein [Cytophagales bacterium]
MPKERKIRDGQITLPNLRTEDVYWYMGLKGGYKIQGNSFSSDLDNQLFSTNSNDLYWEANLGVNKNDVYQLELSYIRNPLKLEWGLNDKSGRPITYFFISRKLQQEAAFSFKRRILTLDKVTRKTRLNLIAGIKYPFRSQETISTYDVFLPTLPSSQGFQDTLDVQSEFSLTKPGLGGILGLEIIGRVAEVLEIGVYAKYFIEKKGSFYSDINFDSTLGPAQNSQQFLNGTSIMTGINIRWNFIHTIQYLAEKP